MFAVSLLRSDGHAVATAFEDRSSAQIFFERAKDAVYRKREVRLGGWISTLRTTRLVELDAASPEEAARLALAGKGTVLASAIAVPDFSIDGQEDADLMA